MTIFANHFTPTSAKETNAQLQITDSFILFTERPTCPYCRCFEPKLAQMAKDNQLAVHFLNSEN